MPKNSGAYSKIQGAALVLSRELGHGDPYDSLLGPLW